MYCMCGMNCTFMLQLCKNSICCFPLLSSISNYSQISGGLKDLKALIMCNRNQGNIIILKKVLTLTVSILSISQGRGHSDDASFSNTHSQEALIHTSNQPPNPDVSVIGTHTGVTTGNGGGQCLNICVWVHFYASVCVNEGLYETNLESKSVPSSSVPL